MSAMEHVDGSRMEGLPNEGFFQPTVYKQERPPTPPANMHSLREVPSPQQSVDPFLAAPILKFLDANADHAQMPNDWNIEGVGEGALCPTSISLQPRPAPACCAGG